MSRAPRIAGGRAVALLLFVAFPLVAVAVEGTRRGAFDRLLDPANLGYVWNSVVLGMTVVVTAAALAVPFAVVVARRTFPGRALLEVAILAPLLTPLHVHTIGWMRIFGRQGLVTEWLAETTGYVHEARAPWFGNVYLGPAWILACALFPLLALPLISGIRALDADQLDAARIAGVSRVGILRRLVLPTLAPRVAAGAFLVFALSLGSFATTSLMDTPVLTQRIFFAFSRSEEGLGGAAVQALPLLLAAALVALWAPRAARVTSDATLRTRRPRPGGAGSWALAALPLLLTSGPPLGGLIAKVVEGAARRPDAPSPLRTVYAQMRPEFASSFLLSGLGVLLLMLIGWPLAKSFARRPSPRVETALAGVIALPPIILGVGVVVAWKSLADLPLLGAVYGSGAALVALAYVARFLPLVQRALAPCFGADLRAQEDAALLSGAGAWRRATRILWPSQRGAVLGVAALCYALCFTELDATLMTYPGDLRTVQVRIFNMVHYSRDEEVAALCLLSVAAALAPPAIVGLLLPRPKAAT